MEIIGQTIRERRKLLCITQRELADLCGVGINTLTKIERGEANPSIELLQRVLITLGLEIEIKVKTYQITRPIYEKGSHILAGYVRRRVDRTEEK